MDVFGRLGWIMSRGIMIVLKINDLSHNFLDYLVKQ